MNCSRWQRMVALSVGGDLSPRQARMLDVHLHGCAACRELDEKLRRDLNRIRSLDALAAGGPDSVRGEVMARIDGRRPRASVFRYRVIAVAAAAAAVILAVFLRWDSHPGEMRRAKMPVPAPANEAVRPEVERPAPVQEEALSPPVSEPPVAEPVVRVARAEAANSTPLLRPAAAEPMTMKILTDDPEVVIYWIVEGKGATDA